MMRQLTTRQVATEEQTRMRPFCFSVRSLDIALERHVMPPFTSSTFRPNIQQTVGDNPANQESITRSLVGSVVLVQTD